MNTFMRKVLAVCLVAAISTVTFGCDKDGGDTNSTPSLESIPQEMLIKELEFEYGNGGTIDATEADATEAVASGNSATENVPVETETVTEYVEVTDESGQNVTETDGSVQTEVVVIPVEPTGGSSEDPGETPDSSEAVTPSEGSNSTDGYTPSYDTCKAYWYNMSQQADFFFNGEFLVIDFVVNETTPDGNYPITISKTDIGSWELVTHKPSIINGEIAVGNATVTSQETAADGEFTLTVNSTTAQPGDTVTVAIDLANNPGFVGFVIDVTYDRNALSIVDTRGGTDFEAAVNYVE